MKVFWKNPWFSLLAVWIGVIFFSSTSLALQLSESLFESFSDLVMPRWPHESSSFGIVRLVADKGLHVTLFTVLGILLWKLLPDSKRKFALAILIGAIVGTCSEILQSFFPDRDPAIRDVIINTCGTALGVAISVAFGKWMARSLPTIPEGVHQNVS